MNWICEPCRERRHDACVGSGQCFCQHRRPTPGEPVTGTPGE